MTEILAHKPRLRLTVLATIVVILVGSEIVFLAVSLGFLQNRAYVSSAIIAMHQFQTNPNPQTELAWCREREHLADVERQFDRVFTLFLVVNTGVLVVCWQKFWRARSKRMDGGIRAPIIEGIGK
jgi:uncharacterized membrane protein